MLSSLSQGFLETAVKDGIKCSCRLLLYRWKHGCTFSERVKYSGKELMENVTKQCPGLTGLANLGNTCYMNAVLQCLCSLSPLVEYFLSGKYKADLQKENNESVTAFRSLMSDMWYGELDCVSPASFHSVLRKWCPMFSRKTQHDAQEFLICLLNELHEALVKSSNSCVPGAESSTASAGETSIITQLFEGQLSYDITCLKCGTTIKKSDSFTVLSLPIPSKTSCSLQDCLKCFFQCNTLTRSDRVHCFFCGTKQNTAVKGTITKAPQIIIFHLKRFEWQGERERKLSTDIYYPLSNLDLSPYSSPHLCKDAEYSLCAVVNHYGLLDDGHYTASCKHLVTENWYRFDDANITQIPDHAVQTDKAYLLFYTCQGLF